MSKQIKPFSTFQLTVITGKNIANRNTEDLISYSKKLDADIPDEEGYEGVSFFGEEDNENDKNEKFEADKDREETINRKNVREIDGKDSGDDKDVDFNDTSTPSKAYTLTEEVQRVLIEDFYPPISSSTVPGNPGRLYITLSSYSSSSPTSTSSPLDFITVNANADRNDSHDKKMGESEGGDVQTLN